MSDSFRWPSGRRVSVLVAMAVVVLLPGCWLQIGAGPGHTRYNPDETGLTAANVDTLQQEWSVEVPGTLSEPMVSEGRVFVTRVGDLESAVRAVDVATGGTLWDTNLVFVPSQSGAFAAGTPVTFVGDELWTGFLGYVPLAPGRPIPGPACALGTVRLDPATGAKTLGATAFPSAATSAAPVVARSLLTVPTTQPCNLSSTTTTLEVVGTPGGGWTETITGLPVGSFIPTLTTNRVLLAHGSSVDAYATNCTESCLVWSRTLSPEPADPVTDGGGTIFVRTGATLVALDEANGATLWRAALGGATGGVAVANGTVFVTSGGMLRAFDATGCGATTCGPEWEAPFDGVSTGPPVVGGGVVYVPDGNSIVAFDADGCGAASCSPLADVAVMGGGRLVLSDGRLFLAGNGRLTALAPA